MTRLTITENKRMKNEKQESSDMQVSEIEKIFISSFHGVDVLFLKPIKQKAIALKLPKDFLKDLILEIETQM